MRWVLYIPPMRTRKLWPFVLVGSFLMLAVGGLAFGWSLAGNPEAKSSPRPSSSPPHPDPNGKSACDMIETAFEDDHSWNDHLLVLEIFKAAAASTTPAISDPSGELGVRLALANAAQGQPDQPERDRNLHESLKELEQQCKRVGLL